MLYSSALRPCSAQAAARGKKTAAVTEPDPDDPLASQYGDLPMVQSVEVTDKKWTAVSNLTTELENTEVSASLHLVKKKENKMLVELWPIASRASLLQVLVRARLHAVRGKGKSAFLVLRQQLATVQAVLFVDDTTVSKGMVKYASAIPRESIVDITGIVAKPNVPVEGCSQSEVGFLYRGWELGLSAETAMCRQSLRLKELCCLLFCAGGDQGDVCPGGCALRGASL